MRRYLIAGLLVWVPLGVTLLVIKLVVGLVDQTLLLVPPALRPDALFGFNIPGFGLLLSVVVVLATGVAVANFMGKRMVAMWESVLDRIPLVRSIYKAAKQVAETMLSDTGKSFRKVLLVEYPRKGVYSIGFLTSETEGEVQERTGEEVVTVFVPTTPNPTSGFIIMVPRRDVTELEMTVDEGFRMIVSLGVVSPPWPRRPEDAPAPTLPPPARPMPPAAERREPAEPSS
ncbi:DUF502 domain-containing protein [Ectothiorhodospiraceae bacterium 2226]|nr:DUF502 domain-containing protein [Ectothiorhodospiraceae bacterium 2226]